MSSGHREDDSGIAERLWSTAAVSGLGSDELLVDVDNSYGHGTMRDWAVFTHTAAAGPETDVPDDEPPGHVLVDGRFVIEDGWRTDVLARRPVRSTPR
ncbi:hypothetical protein [Streptomyces lichenis]|uniref:Uncharacterized protein n=1 Tax=Streptomyces lichenis TaxID=2306967 RepID=A0ABT0IB16_9ACTN|nr:hypothetical protein [Streptomyces lichenis]MCK8678516.1 hypothetical protein [Streptomyces lichenis]